VSQYRWGLALQVMIMTGMVSAAVMVFVCAVRVL
jgi:hypothetical protein